MNRRLVPLILGLLVQAFACGGEDPTTPFTTLTIGTTSLLDGVENVAYSETLTATGGDRTYTWVITTGALPAGLILAASSGTLTGTPSAVGSSAFTVQAASGDGQSATQSYSIAVSAQPILLPSELCSAYPGHAIAAFEDANLDTAIRASLSVDAQVGLTCDLIASLTVLTADNAGITSLAGSQNLTSLTDLALHVNSITDISALSGLTRLTVLVLRNNSIRDISGLSGLTSLTVLSLHENFSISDIGVLSDLTGLTRLTLGGNAIADITALSGLTSLTMLSIWDNAITDVSALVALTSLDYLSLSGNPIVDIGPLGGLTELETLYLARNLALFDIGPLLDNTGLGSGDTVDLTDTNASCADVTALRAKGVTVTSPCS